MDIHFIQWISPNKGETLVNYSKRIGLQIKYENPIFIGLSFGGIVAQEIACQRKVEKLLLISSVAQRSEFPFYFRLLKTLPIHNFLPYRFLKKLHFLNHWLFGVSTAIEKKLLNEIIIETDSKFMKWAIDVLVYWSPKNYSSPRITVHGNKDRILSKTAQYSDYIIKNGGHFMISTHAEEIGRIIRDFVES